MGPTGVELLADEPPGLEVLGDTHYGAGQTRAALRAAGHLQTIKPIPLSSAVPGGFTIHDFQIDLEAATAKWPAGFRTQITSSGRASFARHCQRCPLRQRCTTAEAGRILQVHPHEDDARRGARARAHGARPGWFAVPEPVTVTGRPVAVPAGTAVAGRDSSLHRRG